MTELTNLKRHLENILIRPWRDRVIDVFEALDARLTALAEESYRHYGDSFGEVEQRLSALEEKHNHKPIFDRLSALEDSARLDRSAIDNLQERMHHQECPSQLMLDLVKRVCALDDGSDYEVHPHTCAECTHALELDKYDDILCLRASVWQHPRFESPDSMDCDHHYEREA